MTTRVSRQRVVRVQALFGGGGAPGGVSSIEQPTVDHLVQASDATLWL